MACRSLCHAARPPALDTTYQHHSTAVTHAYRKLTVAPRAAGLKAQPWSKILLTRTSTSGKSLRADGFQSERGAKPL